MNLQPKLLMKGIVLILRESWPRHLHFTSRAYLTYQVKRSVFKGDEKTTLHCLLGFSWSLGKDKKALTERRIKGQMRL